MIGIGYQSCELLTSCLLLTDNRASRRTLVACYETYRDIMLLHSAVATLKAHRTTPTAVKAAPRGKALTVPYSSRNI